jgi:hypothetical protein
MTRTITFGFFSGFQGSTGTGTGKKDQAEISPSARREKNQRQERNNRRTQNKKKKKRRRNVKEEKVRLI